MNEVIIKKIEPVATDDRGSIYDILEAEVNHVGYVTFTKGAVRGKHYHKKSTQYSYVVSGEIELITRNVAEGSKITKVAMTAGDFAAIPPMVIHTYKGLTDAVMLDLTTESRLGSGYEDDTVRVDD